MSDHIPTSVVPAGATAPLVVQPQQHVQAYQQHVQQARQPQPAATIPPGWYRDPTSGVQRWWDGTQWTQHVAAQAPAAQPFAVAVPPVQMYPVQFVAQQPYAQTVIVQQKHGVNHALHLVLTILTAGLWAPVWIILAIANS